MRVLLAEDDAIPRRLLAKSLTDWGYQVIAAVDGVEALAILRGPDPPRLAVLDWLMPGLDGPDVCRMVRQQDGHAPTYIILLTIKDDKADVVEGLHAGANDYVTKPFDPDELRARVQVGQNVVELQASLAARVRELESALAEVKKLRSLLPICCYCKKIRDDRNYWQQVESYLWDHADMRFSHDICPDCLTRELGAFEAQHK